LSSRLLDRRLLPIWPAFLYSPSIMGSNIGPILVTGAGGFIGRHLVQRLSDDPAATVIPTTSDGRDGTRRLDLRDTATLQTSLSGAAALVHCAVGDRSVTVDGTRALLAAAAKAGVRRFVHISSVAVYGDASGTVGEATRLVSGAGQGYGAWKAAAEEACLAQTGLDIVRLRPAIVYGPGSALWTVQLARRIESGRWGVLGSAGEGTCNPVHISDVVSSVICALHAPAVSGVALNVSGTETMSWNEWFKSNADALGAPELRAISPLELKARVFGALPLKAVARVLPGFAADWLLGSPARSELNLFALRAVYPIDLAQSQLGWTPTVGVHDGLKQSVAWLRGNDGGTITQ
jgi:nucleoside-diphosphate-sugar epimerase